MNWLWGFAIAIVAGGLAAGVAAALCARSGRRARQRDRDTLAASHREVLEARDARLFRQGVELEGATGEVEAKRLELESKSAELDRTGERLADAIDGALASAQLLEAEKKRSNKLANELDQIAGQLEAERADAAAQLRGAQAAQTAAEEARNAGDQARKAAEDQAASLGRAFDEIQRIVDAAKVSLGEAGTALDQIRVSAVKAGNGGEAAAPWPELAADATKPH